MDVVCPLCGKKSVIKKGKRKTKLIEKQIYFCKFCKKKFIFNNLKNKTYPAQIIINAISYYNLGYSLSKVSKILNRKFKLKTKRSTIHSWVKSYRSFCTYWRIKERASQLYKPEKMIFETIFHHKQPYKYRYHRAKVKLFLNKHYGLKEYLERLHEHCPNMLFFNDNVRCSCIRIDSNVFVKKLFNNSCRLADITLKSVNDNMRRHEEVQNFMLINDTCTVAAEVPVWLEQKELVKYPFLKNFVNDEFSITGHIDLLQIRFGKIYVLDYKPNAEKETNAVSQLFVYALALSLRAGINLWKIRCAYFDEKNYFEFSPFKVLQKLKT